MSGDVVAAGVPMHGHGRCGCCSPSDELVARLRGDAEERRRATERTFGRPPRTKSLSEEAADEIDRLRSGLARLAAQWREEEQDGNGYGAMAGVAADAIEALLVEGP